jgi:hypothetical protein
MDYKTNAISTESKTWRASLAPKPEQKSCDFHYQQINIPCSLSPSILSLNLGIYPAGMFLSKKK